MNYQNEDYLAKKIAEEIVQRQKETYNRRIYRAWRIALIGACILTGFFTIVFTLVFPFFSFVMFPPFVILLIITIRYCKKHPKI